MGPQPAPPPGCDRRRPPPGPIVVPPEPPHRPPYELTRDPTVMTLVVLPVSRAASRSPRDLSPLCPVAFLLCSPRRVARPVSVLSVVRRVSVVRRLVRLPSRATPRLTVFRWLPWPTDAPSLPVVLAVVPDLSCAIVVRDRTPPMKLLVAAELAIKLSILDASELRKSLWVSRVMVVPVLLQLELARPTRLLRPVPLRRVVRNCRAAVLVRSRVRLVVRRVDLVVLIVVGTRPLPKLVNRRTALVRLSSMLISRDPSPVRPDIPVRHLDTSMVRVRGVGVVMIVMLLV